MSTAEYSQKWRLEHAEHIKAYEINRKAQRAEYKSKYRLKRKQEVLNNKPVVKVKTKQEINEHKAEYSRKYRVAHKEEIRVYEKSRAITRKQYLQSWWAENGSKYHKDKSKTAIWKKAHPEAISFYSHIRRVRKQNAAGSDYITLELLEARWDYYGRRCYVCGAPAEHTDHVKPLSKGGSEWPCNLRPICARCNSLKHAKWPIDIRELRR